MLYPWISGSQVRNTSILLGPARKGSDGQLLCPHPCIPTAALSGTLSGQPPPLPPWLTSRDNTVGLSSGSQACVAPSEQATPTPSVFQDTQSAQEDPPLRLPNTGLLAIPAPLVKRIHEGAFVDMGDLLPEALQWAFDRSVEEKPDRDKRKRFPVENVSDWALSFATYMAIRVLSSPGLATPLAMYMAIILRLAREVTGLAWQRYDRMFRQAVVGNPDLPWDHREPNIWLASIAEQPHQGQAAPVPRAGPKTSTSVEICRRFSRGECPAGSSCCFRHACGICQSGYHPARDCSLICPPAKRPPYMGAR